ncbi:MAG: hypothetical protein RSD68_07610, partial [Oscillospiraceae bacterium]
MTTPWINFLTVIPDTILTVIIVYLILGAKRPLLYCAVHLLTILFFTVFKIFFSSLPLVINTIIAISVFFAPPLIFCKGKFISKLFFLALIAVAMLLADYLGSILYTLIFTGERYIPNSMPMAAMLIGRGIYMFLFAVFSSVIIALKPATLGRAKSEILRKFYLFPLSQMFLIAIIAGCTDYVRGGMSVIMIGFAGVMVSLAASIGMFLAIRELNKKQELEFEAAALQNQLNTQISYYDRLV